MKSILKWMPALLLVSLFSCTREKDIFEAIRGEKPGVYGYLTPIVEEGAETRATVDPDDEWKYVWEVGDKINIWSNEGTLLVYTVKNVSSSGRAEFAGGGFTLTEGETYYSSHPLVRSTLEDYKSLPTWYTGQVQTANNDGRHLAEYTYTYTSAPCTNGNTSFQYHHLTCYLRFVITIPKAMTLTELTITADGNLFALDGKADVTTGVFTPNRVSDSMTLTLDNIEVGENELLKAFMCVAPCTAGTYVIRVKDSEGTVYTSSEISKPDMQVGWAYRFETDVVKGQDPMVCRIGEVGYPSLEDAVAAVPTDGTETTIRMIDNEQIDVVGSAITVAATKNIILDLNGHQVVGTAEGGSTSALITNKGNLTIKDSSDKKADGTGSGQLISGATTTWIYDGGGDYSGSYASNTITNTGTLTIESGYVENLSTGSATYAVDNNSSGADAILNVNGGVLKAHSVAVRQFANSTAKENTVNVSGGTVEAGYSGIWIQLPGSDATKAMKAALNVTGGALTGGSYAFYDYSYGNSYDATQYNLDGGFFNGAIFSYGANISITGGTFSTDVAVKQSKPSEVTVSGGKFAGDVYTYGDNASEGFITGGVFASVTYEYQGETYTCHWCNLLAEGYTVVENTDASTMADYPYAVAVGEVFVAQIGDVKYASLAEAIAAAQAGDVITILRDISDAGSVNIPANVTLDGNDHVISGNSSLILGNGATVTQVNFQNIHNSTSKLSAVYGRASATVTNCTFTDCDWDSIQFTPVAGSELTIIGNTFEETSSDPNSVTAQRFVHIQSAANVDFSATVTGNKMSGTTVQGKLECYYFTDRTKIDLTHNYIDNRNGATGVCVLEKSGANVSEMVYPVYTDADMTTEFTPVAIVKETYSITEYATIQDAFNAQDGKVIAIAAGSHSEVVNVTGGKTATFEPMVGADVAVAGINHSTNGTPSTITVKDITIDNGLQTEGWFTGTSPKINPCVGAWGGHFAFDGCTFKVSGASKYETGIMTWWVVEKTTFDFDNCVFEVSDAAGNKPSSARAMQIYGDVDMTVDGCTFTTAKSYSLKYVGEEGSTAVFNDNTVSNSTCFVQLGSVPYPGTGYSLSLNNTTYSGEIAPYLIDNEENQTVYIDGVKVYPANPVHIGSNSYATIQDAFNAAQNGDVITVDAGTYNEVVNVTGGKTVTIQATAGANVAVAGINHSSNGTPSTITVKGITVDNALQTEGWFTGTSPNINPCVGAWGGHFAFDGCTFKVSGASKYETGIMTWWTTSTTTFDFDNCVFEPSDPNASSASEARAMQIYGNVNLTVDNCTFTTPKRYSLKYVGGENNNAVLRNNTVSNAQFVVELGSSGYPGSNYTTAFYNNTLIGGVTYYSVANEEGQTVYIDGVKVYPAVPDYETDANGNLSIYTAAGMQYFASQVNDSQVSYSGKTITLMDNIDMTGIDWIPIGQTGGYSAKTYFQGTFDGNGKTISNLTVTHWEEGTNGGANYASGLFGFIDAAGATVKDLTMDNANVTGSHWTGAIVGYLSGGISGCTVKNSSIVCTNKNSEANGDKAGLITGYINKGTVTNCTGMNSTVQAYRDAGQIVGAAKSTQVSDCSATNVTVTGTGGGNIRNEVIGKLL